MALFAQLKFVLWQLLKCDEWLCAGAAGGGVRGGAVALGGRPREQHFCPYIIFSAF